MSKEQIEAAADQGAVETTEQVGEAIQKVAAFIVGALGPHSDGFAFRVLAAVSAHQIYLRCGDKNLHAMRMMAHLNSEVTDHVVGSFASNLRALAAGVPDGTTVN